jgi:hypothetical protein
MTTDFKSTRYMEMKSIRERTSGIVNAHGEFKANPLDTPAARRTALRLAKEEMDLHVNGQTGHLTYGRPETGSSIRRSRSMRFNVRSTKPTGA